MMIVIALIALLSWLGIGALNWLRGPDTAGATVEVTQVLERTGQLSTETGILHRVVFDLDQQTYRIEICEGGPAAIERDPEVAKKIAEGSESDETRRAAVEDAKQRLSSLPQGALPTSSDADNADEMALALAGELAARRSCKVSDELFGDSDGKGTTRQLTKAKLTQIYVQHQPEPVLKGMVAIYFFPNGSAEKAIVELKGGDQTMTVLVHGITGQIEMRDSELRDPDDFLLRDATGEKEKER
jgi:hypothetical protein